MNNNLLAAIKQLTAQHGEAILADSKRVNAYLSDMAVREPKPQRMAFIKCLMYGFYTELKNTPANERQRCKTRLAQRLHDEEGTDKTLCTDSVDLLEAALFGTVTETPKPMPPPVAVTAPPQPVTPRHVPEQHIPETILLEGLASGWFFPPGQTFSLDQMNGKFQVTENAISFIPNRFLSIGMYGKNDTIEIQFSFIDSFQKTRWNFSPAIDIVTVDGCILKIAGYGKVNKAFEILCEKMAAK